MTYLYILRKTSGTAVVQTHYFFLQVLISSTIFLGSTDMAERSFGKDLEGQYS